MYILGHPLLALTNIIDGILSLYTIIIIASVILSFFIAYGKVSAYHPVSRILISLTEPAYRKLRRYLPNPNGIDLSPIAVLLLLSFISQGILTVIRQFAQSLLS